MSDSNPYAIHDLDPAALASADERAAFMRRTYTWLMIGIATWCMTMYAVQTVPALRDMAFGLRSKWWLCAAILIGGGYVVRMVSTKAVIGPAVYLAYTFFFGLFVGPLVMYAEAFAPGTVEMASISTGGIFLVLTAYVFISGKDFSFMGGALALVGGTILVTLILGMLFGWQFGIWMSILISVLYSAYILYDTSQILHHLPTHMHIAAAANLFADVALLFYHLLMIFINRDD